MSKILKFLKDRWQENKVVVGYWCWMGIPSLWLLFRAIGIETTLWFVIVSHFFGLYLVARYHLFALENTGEGVKDGKK